MRFNKALPAFLALGAAVNAQRNNDECDDDITITTSNPTISCEVVSGDIIVDEGVTGELSINGPEQLRGNLIITNVTGLVSLSSSTITSIGGRFELQDLNLFSNLQLSSLRSVNEILFLKLPQLGSLTFGTTGLTRASTIRISDTHLSDLSGLRIATVEEFRIDNNGRLITFSSDLVNITDGLYITANGNNMSVEMNSLESAAEIQLSNVRSFEVPALERVSASLKFENNPSLSSFIAPNLTTIGESLTFNNNRDLNNISFPVLTEISADLTVEDNVNLIDLAGFPELTRIFGGIRLAGNFETVELPSLSQVRGAANITTSTDDEEFCNFFQDAKDSDDIEGPLTCNWDDADAISDDADGNTGSGSGSGSGSNSDDEDDDGNAAGMVSVNMAILGVAALAAVTQLL